MLILLILIIGSRFGGKAVPEAINSLDIENLIKANFDVTTIDGIENFSITQLEVLKAIDSSIPVFTFIDNKVMHEQLVYKKNKEFSDKIFYPSIDNQESARYIFEFIDILRRRNVDNAVLPFNSIADIESYLLRQWSFLFQRLLREQRENHNDSKKFFSISEQIEDIKMAIMSTLSSSQQIEIARGVIKYRRLIDFLLILFETNKSIISTEHVKFDELLKKVDIVDIWKVEEEAERGSTSYNMRQALIKKDGTFYLTRFPISLERISNEWSSFVQCSPNSRGVIVDAISDFSNMPLGRIMRYYSEPIGDKFPQYAKLKSDFNDVSDSGDEYVPF